MQIERRVCTYFHRDALAAKVIILCYDIVRHFIVVANIIRRHTTRDFFHTLAVAIVSIRCRRSADGDARQFVFCVIRERVAACRTRRVCGRALYVWLCSYSYFFRLPRKRAKIITAEISINHPEAHAVAPAAFCVQVFLIMPLINASLEVDKR